VPVDLLSARRVNRGLLLAFAGVVLGVGASMVPLTAQPSPRLTFIGVALGDAATTQADRRLGEYLFEKTGARFSHEELEYEQAIQRLVNWRREDGAFVARTTPYAYVVAELLGAEVEPIAAYVSASTGRTTYHSYFVVNRRGFSRPPELPDLLRFLAESKGRAKFIYHSQFSTSSFFLPSLFFRSHRIFDMTESTGSLTAIATERIAGASSAALVERVANGEADLAAVWDGVKVRFDPGGSSAAAGQRVYFIPLPTAIPNDLLVASSRLDDSIKAQVRSAIGAMAGGAINIGDFRGWQSLTEATDARLALGDLRQTARTSAAPVTVEIQTGGSSPVDRTVAGRFVEAARQAVRLSETEFVLFDDDFHGHVDFRWTLEPIHDGAVVLRSAIPGSEVDDQVFQLSFRDADDLTARIVAIVQSRLHRIRYVWPYSAGAPIVLRDSAFALPDGSPVRVQRISWIDPARNQFRAGQMFTSRIQHASFYRYELAREDFDRHTGSERFDPMSHAGFRVILLRPVKQPLFFRVLTVALVGCFVLSGTAAAWTLIRRPTRRGSSGAAHA
jgi:ABC-type phosphate/phosphonate transport system substrate-binding protein